MNATATPPRYQVCDGDSMRDREAVLEVWRGNLGDPSRMTNKYDWFYSRAPAGAPLLQLLLDDASTPIGACAAGRRQMLRDGKPLAAGVLVDLAVMPAHRSLGPAMMLQQALFAAGRRELGLLYGFPNPKAAPVFKRVGYQSLADMVRYVRVLRHAPYLRRKLPAIFASPIGILIDAWYRIRAQLRSPHSRHLHASWHERVPDIEALWSASPKPKAITAQRSPEYLRWRFDEAPDVVFRHLLLNDEHCATAWFATRHAGDTLQIHDAWFRDGGATPTPTVLTAMLEAAYHEGFAAVSIELATDQTRLQPWQALGFVERSQRPVFGAQNASTDHGSIDLHLTAADEDE